MDNRQINFLIASKIMKWKPTKWENHFINESGSSIDIRYTFTESMEYALSVVEKLGLAIIPQSAGNGFRWLVCDIENISYEGERIVISPLNDYYYSGDTMIKAICGAALQTIGEEISEEG